MFQKPLVFRNTTYRELLSFPANVVHDAGFPLGKVQPGLEPTTGTDAFRGEGAMVMRLWDASGTYRVMRGKISQFSIDALIGRLTAAGARVELKTQRAA
jgi:phage-related protein